MPRGSTLYERGRGLECELLECEGELPECEGELECELERQWE